MKTVQFLAGEHTALHVGFPTSKLDELQDVVRADEAFCGELSVAGAGSLDDLYDRISSALEFPEPTRGWDAVQDWATDLEFIENSVGYVVLINDVYELGALPRDEQERFVELWLAGPAAFQFDDRIYHVVFVGADPPGFDVARFMVDAAPRWRRTPEFVRQHGGRSDRIPVVDWSTGRPVVHG